MELRHLATFETVIERGTFLGAARALGCSQSTVTLHVQQLERDLGAALFIRTGKRVHLTEAGHLLAARGRHVLDAVTALRRSIDELGRGAAGRVVLGAIEPAASVRLSPLLARFCGERPALRVRMEVAGARAVARGVAEGDLDLGISSPSESSRRLMFDPLFHEPMAVLLPRRHPLARIPRLRARDLARAALLMTEQGCAWREATERALVERGVPAAPGVELGSIAALQHAVRAGLGVALVPELGPPPPPGTILRRLTDVDLSLPVGILRRPEGPPPSPAVAAFLAELRRLKV
jgi:DNA-binding transcriptional LysR family regulator